MLQREFNYRALMVKDNSGRYRLATRDEIIEAVHVETIDHVVIGEKFYSFAEHGLI